MRFLITGISGFVGVYLARFLISKGYVVYGFARDEIKIEGAKTFVVDITNEEEINEVISEVKPDIIFHLAAVASVKECQNNPQLAKEVNVIGTENLLSVCLKNNIKPVTVVTSTAHVYGIPKYVPLDENHPVNPLSEYAKSKYQQERIALDFFKKHDFPIIITRGFNQIGPEQRIGFVCSDFAEQIAKIEVKLQKPDIVVGDLSPIRDFSDIRDIIELYYLLAKKGVPGDIYNVGSGVGYPMREILNKMLLKTNQDINIIEKEDLFRKSEMPVLLADVTKVRKDIKWSYKIKIDQSIEDILEFWKNKF